MNQFEAIIRIDPLLMTPKWFNSGQMSGVTSLWGNRFSSTQV